MSTVNIIGVPEHFNLPWHMAIEEGAFANRGIDLKWTDIPEGTGRMCQLLEKGEADIAIILTEGIVKSITEGNTVKIAQEYIASPLLWGIHVAENSPYKKLSDLEQGTAAISRFGSGSHLMAYVNAQRLGWDVHQLQFEIANHLDGAVAALQNNKASYFMWEHFTTKPLVDSGVFRRIDDCPTPWPCFVVAVTDRFIAQHKNTLKHILEVINLYTKEFKQIPSIDHTLANRYAQQLPDIKEWLSLTQWSQQPLSTQTLTVVQDQLLALSLIAKKLPANAILLD